MREDGLAEAFAVRLDSGVPLPVTEALQFCNRGNTDGRGRTGRCAKPLIRAQRRGTHGREFREKRLRDSLQVQQEARLRIIDLLNFAGHLYGMLPEIPGKVQERRKQEREQE